MIRINLLPRAAPRRVSGRRLFEFVIPAAVFGLLVLAYLVMAGRVEALRQEIVQADAEIAQLQPQVAAVGRLKEQIEEARKKEDLLAQLLATQLPASSILSNLRVLIPKEAWIISMNVPDTSSFTLDGFALTYPVVARFMDNLESARLFDNLDLAVVERDRIGGTEVVKFQVNGKLIRPTAVPVGGR